MVVMGVVRNLEQVVAHGRLSNLEEAKADLGAQIPILTVLCDLGDPMPLTGPLISLSPASGMDGLATLPDSFQL